jgi:TonB family protein
VTTTAGGTSTGTGTIEFGGGSSVREGLLTGRDVLGSPDGVQVATVNTTVGEGYLRGSGGTGTSIAPPGKCFGHPAVVSYLSAVKEKTIERWVLPASLGANQKVTLRFRLDVAGSATKVSLVQADDKSLGLSAIDALRAASPFPPIPDAARCLADKSIKGTFTNPGAG